MFKKSKQSVLIMLRHLFFSLYAIIPVFLQASKEVQDNKGDFIDEESAYEELVEELVFESLEDDLDPQDANLQIATKSSEKQEQRLASENLVSDGNGQIFPNNLTQSREKNFNLPLDHPGLFGSMEFLWWQLNETSLDYTVHQTSPVTSLQSSKALTLGHVHTESGTH